MADAGFRAAAAGNRSVALAALALFLAAPPAFAATAAAEPQASSALAAVTSPAVATNTAAAGPPSGFTLRRVPNPRYRPPALAAPALGIATVGPLSAIDHLRVQLARRAAGARTSYSEWQLFAGEQRRDHDAIELSAAGEARYGRSSLRTIALAARRGDLLTGLGDVPSIGIGRMGSLQRLRGLSVISLPRDGVAWRGVSGVPTPLPGQNTPRMVLAGTMVENLKTDDTRTTIAMFGFGRGRVAPAQAATPGDTSAGAGGMASVDVRAPLPLGALAFAIGAQIHDLDGSTLLAAQQGLGWSLVTPVLALAFDDERATDRTRLLRTDGLTPAATREDRWNAQARMLRGRAETHFTGVVREGGDPSIAARTMQAGGSGNWGASSWYSGADLYFTRRMIEGVDERRLSVYSGRISSTGHALVLRYDRTTDDLGRDATQASAELALALARGGRFSVEPRCAWDEGRAQQAAADLRLTWPFAPLATRVTAFVSLGATPGQAFRPALHEAALAIALAPRARDHAEIEVRRRDDYGLPTYETTASYDLSEQRYESLHGARPGRDEGLITVRVLHAGDHAGVSDVLVMLDGRESRFTDASGVAHFERVAPGVHIVSVEERSLPAQQRVMTAGRILVTVERGRDTDPVTFEIARPERRTKF
jgi:hypothetical protein